jgi:hypothetical protein
VESAGDNLIVAFANGVLVAASSTVPETDCAFAFKEIITSRRVRILYIKRLIKTLDDVILKNLRARSKTAEVRSVSNH